MVTTMEAFFDGRVFRPAEPPSLEPNTRVRITIEPVTETSGKPVSFLDVARSLNLDGPRDWSENLEKYLYGGDTDGKRGLP